ncbi:hypothetical protein CCR95_14375 [Thiocystis minor]|uniref:DUF5610 domain-containing protein n=1 Tax=Thiocystis minor TaxID=61597 RepID=UPI0019147390|nr:hypothetical protein [Thiocystis minor]
MINIHSYSASQANFRSLTTASQSAGQGLKTLNESAKALSSLQDGALNALAREIPGMEATEFSNLDASEYTPDKIANRIGQFVALGLDNARAQGKSEEEVQSLYDSAMKGVEQGFKEAKEILKNLDLLGGGIGEQVKATEDATFAALEKLSPAGQSQDVAGTATLGMASAQRYQRAEDFNLSLQTKDGDTVKISFSRDFAAQQSNATVMDEQGNQVSLMDVSQSENSGYQFKVEGNLSVEEIDAIQALVSDIGKVANDFFRGDVEKAFSQVSNVAFDDSQLASMNLRMSRTEQYSAVQQYQQTQQLENPEQAQSGRRLGHLMREMRDSFQNPALEFLSQAREAASQIMRGLVEQDSRFQDASPERQSKYQNDMERLLSAVTEPSV